MSYDPDILSGPLGASDDNVKIAMKLYELDGMEPPEALIRVAKGIDPLESLIPSMVRDPSPDRGVTLAEFMRSLRERPWRHTNYQIGLAPQESSETCMPILGLYEVEPVDDDGRLTAIHLDRFHVAEYPGSGTHRVVCVFDLELTFPREQKAFTFSQSIGCSARDGEFAALVNVPLFTGIPSNARSALLRCRTYNVRNESDTPVFACLANNAFEMVVQFAGPAYPVLSAFSTLISSTAESLQQRRRNVCVQEFEFGLTTQMGSQLVCGQLVAAQLSRRQCDSWCWADYRYDRSRRLLVGPGGRVANEFNYVLLGLYREG